MSKLKKMCKKCNELCKICARGMCAKCYAEWYYKIQTELNQKKCTVCGEIKTRHAKEMCRKCYCKTRDPIKRKKEYENRIHKNGKLLLSENKECSMFLGVHIAERVLSKVFKNVKRMQPQNPGYDFICNNGKKIDVKSSCHRIRKHRPVQWSFVIKQNTTADFFLCIAFDNRNDLNPLHLWLIPGKEINMYEGVSISKTTLSKWDKFELQLEDVISHCNLLKNMGE